MLDKLSHDLRRASGSFIKLDVTRSPRAPRRELVEPNDMRRRVDPPCHPKEPLKVLEDWTEAVHYIVCGEAIRAVA